MNHLNRYNFQVFLIIVLVSCITAVIQEADNKDLVRLITKRGNLIVLFTKSQCRECDELELALERIQNDLKKAMDAVVVKAHNSYMVNAYNPAKEPALIYFRSGIPMLYHGEINGEDIFQLFSENREPIVKELSDENFEHLTQAASGATTGDWFIFFYSKDCVECIRLNAMWETVGAKLKHRLNVARVNRLNEGSATAKRFTITASPEFLFLRHGKAYRYRSKDYTAGKLIEFAEGDYMRLSHPEPVQPLENSMKDLLSDKLDTLMKHPQFVMVTSIIAGIIFVTLGLLRLISKWKSSSSHQKKIQKKSK